jgi:hypothetical protein
VFTLFDSHICDQHTTLTYSQFVSFELRGTKIKTCCALSFLGLVANMTQDRTDVRENGKIKTKQLVHNFDQNNGKKENRNGIGQKCIAHFAQRPEANNAELCINSALPFSRTVTTLTSLHYTTKFP